MSEVIKQIICDVSLSEPTSEEYNKIGDEEAFREIFHWDSFIEIQFFHSLCKVYSKELDPDELKGAETVNQVKELLNEYK